MRPALFALAAGLAVANVYTAQPLLDTIAAAFALSPGAAGLVLAVTQIGYGVGLLALVPLGDALDRRRLIVALVALSAVALAVVGAASSRELLLLGMAAVGLLAVVAQVLVAYAAALARPHERGRIVGAVTSGIVVGILLARTVAGLVTALAGWRAVYLGSAVLMLIVVAALLRGLPADARPRGRVRYGALLRSTFALYVDTPVLRVRGTLALLTFAGFSVLWASLALELAAPPRSLSPAAIGALGLAGAAGAVAAARAGRLADRGLGDRTTSLALAAMFAAWLPLALVERSLVALVLGLVALEVAVQAVHVTNQSVLYTAESRSRLAGCYMAFYSAGSAAGAVASTATYAWAGWAGVCALGAAIGAAALSFWVWVGGEARMGRAEACSSSSRIASVVSDPCSSRSS
ncbi:MAG TPA: MFS transporter [Solirubrobacter sp.]|nr:MFS transporter [Solirubrobacter sp.]